MDTMKSIEVLDGKNFSSWRKKLMFFLSKDDLWGHIDGSKVLEENMSQKEIVQFHQDSQKAKAIIGLHVSNDLDHIVAESPDPKTAF